jgi:urease accessory protein
MPQPITAAPPSTQSRSWQGHLNLEFSPRSDKTILSHAHVQAPLKVQRPFYPEGPICHTVMLHTAGGIVGGDQLNISIHLQPQTQALLTSAAATKVYRTNGLEAQQTIHLQLDSHAHLEWLPQETILFNEAQYRQQLKVELADQATWIGWEMTRLGRSARGEQFNRGEWHSRTEVWQNDRLIWIDPQWIAGGSNMLTSPHGLATAPVIGSFAFVGQVIPQTLLEKIRALIPADFSLTRLQSGLLCRYRGDSTAAARDGFILLWHLLRQECLNQTGCIPRVWQL